MSSVRRFIEDDYIRSGVLDIMPLSQGAGHITPVQRRSIRAILQDWEVQSSGSCRELKAQSEELKVCIWEIA
jgi:hypothetical protein